MRYDPLGRLYEVTGSATGTTRFLYSGDELVAEYNTGGTLLRRYVHGGGAGALRQAQGDRPLVWFEGSGVGDGARRYLYSDERGSIVAVSDSNGSSVTVNSYDEYGIPAAGNAGRFGYTGQAWLPELGMFYYKARMYSPTLGRFMQTDPIGYGDGMNMYAYVGGDPVNGVDPSGLRQCTAEEIEGIVRGSGMPPPGQDPCVILVRPRDYSETDRSVMNFWLTIYLEYDDPNTHEWAYYGVHTGTFIDAETAEVPERCPNAGAFAPTVPEPADLSFLIHGHQDLSQGEYYNPPYPGPGDGFFPVMRDMPSYVASSTDLWRIDPNLSVFHLQGTTDFPTADHVMMLNNANRARMARRTSAEAKPC